MLDEVDHLTLLIDDLLRLARGDSRPPGARSVVDIADTVAAETAPKRRVPVEISAARACTSTATRTPWPPLRNLLDNAERHASSRITVSALTSDGGVRLEVTDDGAGVAAEDRERIFERFVRLDDGRARSAGGTGLGLAIVEQIVADHGGTVTSSMRSRGSIARRTIRRAAPRDGPRRDLRWIDHPRPGLVEQVSR